MDNNTVVVGVFEDRNAAEEAVDELEQSGFAKEDVGFAIRGSDAVEGGMITDAEGAKDKEGALAGAATGAVAGGLLGALAAAVIPGIGPVLSAGILTTALGFAGAGAAVGGILGAMTGLGVSQEEALYYEQEFNAGKAIVTVRAGDFADKAVTIIRRHGGYTMRDRNPPPGGGTGERVLVTPVAPA
jgi:Heat induced stress protein YflT